MAVAVTDDDAFRVLGLPTDASADDIRAARRELAKRHHPDQGGDPATMQAVNEAADHALTALGRASSLQASASPVTPPPPAQPGSAEPRWSGVVTDVPSFTVEALPVDTFEALLVVTSWMGEVLDDDPPYRLDTHLHEPFECWCRLDIVPDAGASTVSLTVAGVGGAPTPDIITVRDLWIAHLNTVHWT
jgi:hypothetical protein